MTTKATIYLNEKMYKTAKIRAIETNQSVSAIMNEALQALLYEDLSDINSIRKRKGQNQKSISYDQALTELKNNGII